MNVVENWRRRARSLRGQYLRCHACGAFAAVRRLVCASCGADMSRAALSTLPRSLPAVAFSHSHIVVEAMNQTEDLNPVILVRVGDRQLMALPLCESDTGMAPRLVGEKLGLALRRKQSLTDPRAPIDYERKLAASAATRAKLKRNELKAK